MSFTVENETQEEYNKRIWNAAIEEAIIILENSCDVVAAKKNIREIKEMSLPDIDRSVNPCPICGINNNSPFPCEHYRGKPDVIKAALSMGKPKGGYCPMCDTVWVEPGICNCSTQDRLHRDTTNVYKTEVWNAAIEAAADLMGIATTEYYKIRKLKK